MCSLVKKIKKGVYCEIQPEVRVCCSKENILFDLEVT